MRMMAYFFARDYVDDKIGMSETTKLKCMTRFCDVLISKFERKYLQNAATENVRRILSNSEKLGFPCMLELIDCSKCKLRNCPKTLHYHYRRKNNTSVVTLEATTDQSLRPWHAFFEIPECLNDISFFEASPLLEKTAWKAHSSPVDLKSNFRHRNKPYCRCDAIYPRWPMFIAKIFKPL